MEKDQVRGNDSLVTFEEILQIAKERNVSLYDINLSEHSVKNSDEYVQHCITPILPLGYYEGRNPQCKTQLFIQKYPQFTNMMVH